MSGDRFKRGKRFGINRLNWWGLVELQRRGAGPSATIVNKLITDGLLRRGVPLARIARDKIDRHGLTLEQIKEVDRGN